MTRKRAWARHVTRRELRIVCRHGARPHDDGVAEGAHAVHVTQILATGDELRLTGVRRDEAIEAFTEMPDGDRPRFRRIADRQIQIDEGMLPMIW